MNIKRIAILTVLFLVITSFMKTTTSFKTIFDFNTKSDIRSWKTIDDRVMGGRSSSTISLNADGAGVFEGDVSLENNGGFSSVRYNFEKISVKWYSKVRIRLRGDTKRYQFRLKSKSSAYYSYIAPFETNGDWQTIEIPLKELYPSFRGRRLEQENFSHESIEELAFLIGNKHKEHFKLEIDNIELI